MSVGTGALAGGHGRGERPWLRGGPVPGKDPHRVGSAVSGGERQRRGPAASGAGVWIPAKAGTWGHSRRPRGEWDGGSRPSVPPAASGTSTLSASALLRLPPGPVSAPRRPSVCPSPSLCPLLALPPLPARPAPPSVPRITLSDPEGSRRSSRLGGGGSQSWGRSDTWFSRRSSRGS